VSRPGQKILQFCHPRSGSSNVYQILQRHPDLDILPDPFDEKFVKWVPGRKNYRATVHDLPSLQATVSEILEDYDGFKLSDYQLKQEFLEYLLKSADLKIIYTRRRNLLKMVVSTMISHQTGVWHKERLTRPLEEHYGGLSALPIEEVRERLELLSDSVKWCDALLRERPSESTFWIAYEEFYFSDLPEQVERLKELWEFVGVDPIPEDEDVLYFLRPERSKLNSATTYAMVPNIKEVEEACGSDESGWLLASHRD